MRHVKNPFQFSIKRSLSLFGSMVLLACSKNNEPISAFEEAEDNDVQIVALNTSEGYSVNQLTQDSIQLHRTSTEPFITGKTLYLTETIFEKDSLATPTTIAVTSTPEQINAHPFRQNLTTELPSVTVDINSLVSTSAQAKVVNDSTEIGTYLDLQFPQTNKSLPPRYKDVASNDLKYLDIEHGLPSSYVVAILEDSRGYLWIGTDGGGLCRYNGESVINMSEKEGISDDFISSLIEDSKGNIWIGTQKGGVMCYDGNQMLHFSNKDGLCNNSVQDILEDQDGRIWISTTAGISIWDGKTISNFTEENGLVSNITWRLEQDESGKIWIGSSMGITCYENDQFTHYSTENGMTANFVISLYVAKNNDLWIGTYGGGAMRFNGESFQHFTSNEGIASNAVSSFLEDEYGNIWIGNRGTGLNKYDGKSIDLISESSGLSNNDVRALYSDSRQNIWIGTWGGGLNRYNQNSFDFFDQNNGLSNDIVWSIYPDSKGNVWFGTYSHGALKYDGNTITSYTQKEGLPANAIMSLTEDNEGNMWFGTLGFGFSKFDGQKITNYNHQSSGTLNNDVRIIESDSKGNIWIGTWGGGVCKYNDGVFSNFSEEGGLANNRVSCIYEDSKGQIWIGSDGAGVSCVKVDSIIHYTVKEGLSNNWVMTIFEDSQGNMWFGTDGGGANCFDGDSFHYYTQQQGLTNNRVWSILEDADTNIWISTEKGLNRINSKDQTRIDTYSKDDGLKYEDFFMNSVCRDQENRIWWGNGKNVAMMNASNNKNLEAAPRVMLNRVDLAETFIDYRNLSSDLAGQIEFDSVAAFENYPINLVLPHDKNHLTFHFSGIDWGAAHQLKFQYMLGGLDDNWNQPSSRVFADYRNVPYGDYTFKLRAKGASQIWSDEASYSFTILPPWWHTWWARVLYVLIGIALLYGFLKWRTRKLRNRQKELEKEIDIATHEIRSQKEVVEQQKEETEKQRDIIEEAHREITDSIAYAKRIQSAILPPLRIVKEYLTQSFILYKPKDVVAGDFYWMEHADETVFFAAADCTGHGVPGAMVSVVCNNGLNRSIREHGLTEPGKILDKTREIIIQEFEKSEEEVKDGMDIALCGLKGNNLTYAGAYNPLWIIRKDGTEIEEIKADKQPIGKFAAATPFTTHTVKMNSGDTFYLFSDGFSDQFGGEKGKKFKSANFKRLLLSIQHETMDQQSEILFEKFELWRGPLEQVDDVCIIGVRI